MPLRVLMTIWSVVSLFLPVTQTLNAYGDLNEKKFAFSLYLFGFLRLVGGYVTSYKGGVALHVSKKTAILLPYSGMNEKRKKFSFVRTFHLISLSVSTESGAEYFALIGKCYLALKAYLKITGRAKKSKTNLLLTNGDGLKTSVRLTVYFTMAELLATFINFLFKSAARRLKQKWKKKEKSTV